jgi:hypothetical protein
MARFVFDFGNARGKWFLPCNNIWGDFMHAVAPLNENEWQGIVGRGKPPKGLIKVNGLAYAIGEAARRHVITERPKGAARYNELYYLPAACFAFSEAFEESAEISLYASHAPQDQRYVQDLVRAVKGKWTVECQHGILMFHVKKVVGMDEPICGYAHYVFTKSGEEQPNNPIADKTVLLVDVGGYTADRVAVDPGGQIDLLSIESTRAGTIAAVQQFEKDMRSRNRHLFKNSGDLDIRRVEQAMITGVYRFGKIEIDCSKEAGEAINTLVNDVIQVINAAGGAANYDVILLTGGGSALIYDALTASFPAIDFIMVEPDRSLMKFANVFGGAKLAALMARLRQNNA